MKAPSKMTVAVGALALTAATLLAGCGGSSTASTAASAASEPAVSEAPAASEAAVSEPAAAEVPATVWEGTVKPADVTDDGWATVQFALQYPTLADMANATPKELAEMCNAPKNELAVVIADMVKEFSEGPGTAEEWTQVWETVFRNYQRMACSMAN